MDESLSNSASATGLQAGNLLDPTLSRRAILGAALAAGIGGLAGCGSSSSSSSSSKDISFWKPPDLPDDSENKFYADLMARFAADHKNVKSSHLIIPWDSGMEKYTAAFASNPPDVAYLNLPWLNNFMGKSVFEPLENLSSSLDPVYADNRQALVAPGLGKDGKHYAVPYTTNYWVLTVNTKVWKRAGSPPPPKTYEEMIPFARKLTFDKNGRQYGESGFDPKSIATYGWLNAGQESYAINYLFNALWSYGADYLNEDGNDIGYNNDEGRAALKVMKDLVDSGAATPPSLYAADQWYTQFLRGRIGMAWFYGFNPDLEKQFPEIPVKALPAPAGPAGSYLLAGGGWLTIPKRSKNKMAAFELLSFIANKTNQGAFCREARLDPVTPIAADFWDGIPSKSFLDDLALQGDHARLTRSGIPFDAENAVAGAIVDYLNGHKSLDDMINDSSKQIKLMAKNAGK